MASLKMFNIPLISILVFPLVVLGPLFPVLPIETTITMRIAIGAIILSMGMAWFSGRLGIRSVGYISFFALLICIVPMIIKGYDSFYLAIILGCLLGFVAFQYYKISMPILGLFAFLCIYLLYYFFRFGNLNSAFYMEIYGNTTGASRNFVGVVMLQYYLIYYAVCIANRLKPVHWPLFVMPVIAIMSGGVSSTLVASALLVGYLLVKLKVKFEHGILGLVFIVLFGLIASRWIESTLFFERLTAGEFVVSRLLLWSDFFYKLDSHSIFIGFSKDTAFVDHEVSLNEVENLHNSYLNLYKKVGVFSLIYFWLIGYIAFSLYKINKVLFIVYWASLFRAATDGYYFSSFMVDFIIFYLFLLTPFGEKLVLRAR